MRLAKCVAASFLAFVLVLTLFTTHPVKAQSSNTIIDVGNSVTAPEQTGHTPAVFSP